MTEERVKEFPPGPGPDGKGREVGDWLCGGNASPR